MIQAIASGITSATPLSEKLRIPIQSVSRWAKRLQTAGWLRKDGKIYALTPKAKKLTPQPESSVACGSSPVNDVQTDGKAESRANISGNNLKNFEFRRVSKQGDKGSEPQSFRTQADAKRKRKTEEEPLFFSTDDWRDFLDLATLPRKAGCSLADLARVVYKEAADNATDTGTNVLEATWTDPNGNAGWAIKDHGHGLDPEQVPTIYSPNRPQLSSKRMRRIQRGILGNGCRVIGGAVAASGGSLMVNTRGHRLSLQMDTAKGKMDVVSDEPIPPEPGLTLYIALGPAIAVVDSDFDLAKATIQISYQATRLYSGPSSPWWHGPHNFYRLAQEVKGNISFSQLCRKCGFVIAGIIQPSWRRPAKDFSFPEIKEALLSLRSRNRPVPVKKLGELGALLFAPNAYAKQEGIALLDDAELPYVLEAWAQCARPEQKANGELKIELLVNGSKTPAKLYGHSTPEKLSVRGCDLNHRASNPPKTGNYTVTLSIITPYLPLTNEGKEPSLKHIWRSVLKVVYKAARKAHGALERPERIQIKDAAWAVMEKAYQLASGNGRYPALARQIMYSARPDILSITGRTKFDDKYFTQTLLPDYLREHPAETADWNIAFDPRGHGTEPHTELKIAMGTLAVRAYLERIREGIALSEVVDLPPLGLFPTYGPLHRYKDVLFIEKEGFDPLLASARIAQRYDIFIVSTKGMSVTALRRLVDELSECGVERIFVLHDFDTSGFSILGTLGVSGRRYQFKNQVAIIDLGLRLADIDEIERLEGHRLQSEPIDLPPDPQKRARRLDSQAGTLARHGASPEEIEFLSSQRTELNMMNAPQFVRYIERKLNEHRVTKVIPDAETLVLQARRYYEWQLTKRLLDQERDRLKAEAAETPVSPHLDRKVGDLLAERPELAWDTAVVEILSKTTTE
jgi:hypothetical protein